VFVVALAMLFLFHRLLMGRAQANSRNEARP